MTLGMVVGVVMLAAGVVLFTVMAAVIVHLAHWFQQERRGADLHRAKRHQADLLRLDMRNRGYR